MADSSATLTEMTEFMLETLRSSDPRRFFTVHRVSRTATKFIRATSLRVEDFEEQPSVKKSVFFKERILAPQVLVPEPPSATVTAVLDSMTVAIVEVLGSSRPMRVQRGRTYRGLRAQLHRLRHAGQVGGEGQRHRLSEPGGRLRA